MTIQTLQELSALVSGPLHASAIAAIKLIINKNKSKQQNDLYL